MFKKTLLLLFVTVTVLSSCDVNSNVMWKQPKGTEVNSDDIPLSPEEEYKISVNDKIAFTIATNNGAIIVENLIGEETPNGSGYDYEYEVRSDGMVELPKIGKVTIEGLTIDQCEDTLEAHFSQEYNDPFVKVRITNQRVIVFPGNGSDAKVIPLLNTNTTLMEAIAQAGGITDRGKANTVKLMRKVDGERKVYVMDLSVIEGLKYADMIVQANDYIYIEPAPELGRQVRDQVVPVLTILTSAVVIFSFINSL